jgi:hypothetical protein
MTTVLAFDSRGPEVERVQTALQAQGYWCGAVDGWYGLKTAAAVGYFQSVNGLDIDGVAGPQVYAYLDLDDDIEVSLRAIWPAIEVWHSAEQQFVVGLEPFDGTAGSHVRVVVWFRGPHGEDHVESTVELTPGMTTSVPLELPPSIAQHEGEVHFVGHVFDMHGERLGDEGTGSFRIDLPTPV